MDRPQPSRRLAPALIATIILFPTLYVLGYIFGSKLTVLNAPYEPYRWRCFDSEWKCVILAPAAWMEAKIFASPLSLCHSALPAPKRVEVYAAYGEH
jgi:hypothetical protein